MKATSRTLLEITEPEKQRIRRRNFCLHKKLPIVKFIRPETKRFLLRLTSTLVQESCMVLKASLVWRTWIVGDVETQIERV